MELITQLPFNTMPAPVIGPGGQPIGAPTDGRPGGTTLVFSSIRTASSRCGGQPSCALAGGGRKFNAQRLRPPHLTCRNVEGSYTRGDHAAEIQLAGWACKTRTQKRRGKISL